MTSSSLTLTPGESEVTLLYDWVTISVVPKGPHSFLLYGDNKIAMEQAEDLAAEGPLPQDWSRALRLRRCKDIHRLLHFQTQDMQVLLSYFAPPH